MNAVEHKPKGDDRAVYGTPNMIPCAHPRCNEVFEEKGHKKYHSTDCKNNHHALEREAGKKILNQGTIRAALLEGSKRLQRVAKFLSDGKPHSTREIIRECDVCAVNAIVDELREPKNGFEIVCKQVSRSIWKYTMIGGFENLLRIP